MIALPLQSVAYTRILLQVLIFWPLFWEVMSLVLLATLPPFTMTSTSTLSILRIDVCQPLPLDKVFLPSCGRSWEGVFTHMLGVSKAE